MCHGYLQIKSGNKKTCNNFSDGIWSDGGDDGIHGGGICKHDVGIG